MTAKEIQKDHQRLLANLQAIQKAHSVAELAELLGISKGTWINRMKEPWSKFSYDDLRAISRYCRIDFIALTDGDIKLR